MKFALWTILLSNALYSVSSSCSFFRHIFSYISNVYVVQETLFVSIIFMHVTRKKQWKGIDEREMR